MKMSSMYLKTANRSSTKNTAGKFGSNFVQRNIKSSVVISPAAYA